MKAGVKLSSFQSYILGVLLDFFYKELKPKVLRIWRKISSKNKVKKVIKARGENDKDSWRKSIDDL